MEVFEEHSRRAVKERVSEFIRTEKIEEGQSGLLRSLKYIAPARQGVVGKRTSGSGFLQSGGVGTI